MFITNIQQRKLFSVLGTGLFLSSTPLIAMDVDLDVSSSSSTSSRHWTRQSVGLTEDIIKSVAHFNVALAQEEEGQHDLANFNYHLAYGEPTDKALHSSSIGPIDPLIALDSIDVSSSSTRSLYRMQQRNSNDDIIKSVPHFNVALAQEEEGQHDLANFNYHLAYGEPTDRALHISSIGPIGPIDPLIPSDSIGRLVPLDPIDNYSKRVKKDMKMRKMAIFSSQTQKAGNCLHKKVAPCLFAFASDVVIIPDPSGITFLIGGSVAIAGGITKGGGTLIKSAGGKVKKHYCQKINTDPSTLNAREEKALIKKEKKFLKAIKKSKSLQEKINKNDAKQNAYIDKKYLKDDEISDLRSELIGEPKLNYLNDVE
jgi:hypothetical protein